MTAKSQRKAAMAHRTRAKARGLVRVETQVARGDAGLVRAVAETLRRGSAPAARLRSALESALVDQKVKNAFDVFGSDLPDDAFEGIFDQARPSRWRESSL